MILKMIRLILLITLIIALIIIYYKYSTLKYNYMCIHYKHKKKINNYVYIFLLNVYNTNTILLEYLSNDIIKELMLQTRIPYKVIELFKICLKEVNQKIKKYLSK